MPELPEVHTTVEGIKKEVVGKTIEDVWSDFHIGTKHKDKQNIKNKKYFDNFRKIIIGKKIISAERKGKNILIHLNSGYTIIIHMKMTGHLMIGRYKFQNYISSLSTDISLLGNSSARLVSLRKARSENNSENKRWVTLEKGPLEDPYNQYIHFALSLSNGKTLVLSDMRKFASVCIEKTDKLKEHSGLSKLGEDALEIKFQDFKKKILSQKKWPIKAILMNQNLISGIGNIYSDEILWATSVHPLSHSSKIPNKKLADMYKSMKKIFRFSILKGGDSKSDYRNIYGEKGGFQNFHKVYGHKNKPCPKRNCGGIIERMVVKGRSSHFCPLHQKKYYER